MEAITGTMVLAAVGEGVKKGLEIGLAGVLL